MVEIKNDDVIGKKVKIKPEDPPVTSIDLDNNLEGAILSAARVDSLKTDVLESFSSTAQNRENEYELIDTMAMDSTIAAALETYAEDIVQTNDKGEIFWIESDDADVARYVTFLLKRINFDKQAYKWAYNLTKYGDVYVKLVRKSEFENSVLFTSKPKSRNDKLEEDVKIVINSENDHYADTLDTVRNPGEMFELTKYGKTIGYIKAPVNVQKDFTSNNEINTFITYRMRRKDVEIYSPTEFVHACLEMSQARACEDIDIFITDDLNDIDNAIANDSFEVRRGTGILNDLFKVWRQLTLMENAILLSRITRSSITRAIQMEVGDMPQNQVMNVTSRVKALLEQKSAIEVGTKMSEYLNPGSVENIVILPTRNGKGGLNMMQIGGDYDPKTLTDLDWFNNKLFGGLKIPKQYLSWTDDSAGFNGGSSLSIISARYGKAIKRMQNCLIQMVTDALNNLLIDKGYSRMVNNFRVMMQAPVTQEEIDKKQELSNSLRNVTDIMSALGDISEPLPRLKVLQGLLADVLSNQNITNILQEEIDKLEEQEAEGQEKPNEEGGNEEDFGGFGSGLEPVGGEPADSGEFNVTPPSMRDEEGIEEEPTEPSGPGLEEEPDDNLPSPNDLGLDLTDNTAQ